MKSTEFSIVHFISEMNFCFKTKTRQYTTLSALTGLTVSLFKQLLNNPKQ